MASITICSDFGAPEIKSDTVSTVSPFISHEVMGPDAMILVFWMFKLVLGKAEEPESKLLTSAGSSKNQDHGIWSHQFMGNRWGNSGNSGWLNFGGSKITADGDCSHEIKRRLLLGRKVMIDLDSIFKSRDITLPTKVRLVKAMVF